MVLGDCLGLEEGNSLIAIGIVSSLLFVTVTNFVTVTKLLRIVSFNMWNDE